jgi:hypothetical protein
MTVHIDISSRQKMTLFLELLKSVDFVERVRVDEETQSEIVTPLPSNDSLTADDKLSFFSRFYGSLQSGLSIDEIDHQLQTLRNEWDRPTW